MLRCFTDKTLFGLWLQPKLLCRANAVFRAVRLEVSDGACCAIVRRNSDIEVRQSSSSQRNSWSIPWVQGYTGYEVYHTQELFTVISVARRLCIMRTSYVLLPLIVCCIRIICTAFFFFAPFHYFLGTFSSCFFQASTGDAS